MLRNAFELLATEGTLRKLVQQLHFARDLNDRLRVVVDAGSAGIGLVTTQWASQGNWSAPYGNGSPSSMDAREMQRAQVRTVANQARARWSIT